MTEPDVNPYAPSLTQCELHEHRVTRGSYAITSVSLIGFLVYLGFTTVLLRSSPADRQAGMMFLANVPVLAGLVVVAFSSKRLSAYLSIGAAAVQIAITLIMLLLPLGDLPIVILINTAIILPCLAVGIWAWVATRADEANISANGDK